MFIDIDSHLINMDHVKKIVRLMKTGEGRRQEVEVVFADGTERRFPYAWEPIKQRLMGTIIAAPAGWQVACAVYEGVDDTGPLRRIDVHPVIAFSVDGHCMIRPIGLGILPANRKALVAPDGKVFDGWDDLCGGAYENLDVWREHLEAELERDEAPTRLKEKV